MTGALFPALEGARPLPAEIHGDARLSSCGQYRWTLRRWWRAGPHLCFCGLNPSTADHEKNDPTVLRWIHFANAWGFAGFVAVNLYPLRTPNAEACRRWSDWLNNGPDYYALDALAANLQVVAEHAQDAAMFVACWGAAAWDGEWIERVIEEVQTADDDPMPIHCLGKTAGGAPIHPMARGIHRVPDNQQPVLWRAA